MPCLTHTGGDTAAARQPDPSVLVQLTELAQRLDARAALAQLDPDELDKTFGGGWDLDNSESEPEPETAQRLEVCPELYHGAADDAPLHTTGFVTEQCKVTDTKARAISVDWKLTERIRHQKTYRWNCARNDMRRNVVILSNKVDIV